MVPHRNTPSESSGRPVLVSEVRSPISRAFCAFCTFAFDVMCSDAPQVLVFSSLLVSSHLPCRFLEFQPWASYFCSRQGCACSSVEYQFGPHMRKCKGCGHSPMTHYSHFNKYVLNPIKKYGNVGEGRRAMRRLRRDVLGAIVLRRTKQVTIILHA